MRHMGITLEMLSNEKYIVAAMLPGGLHTKVCDLNLAIAILTQVYHINEEELVMGLKELTPGTAAEYGMRGTFMYITQLKKVS